MIEQLAEIETEFKNISAYLWGAQTGSNYEKIEVENLVKHFL